MSTCVIEERASYNAEYRTCADENETEKRRTYSWDSHRSEAECVSKRMATGMILGENNSDMSDTERKRLYIRQSQQTACMMTQGTTPTRLLSRTDLDTIECKCSNGRDVRFCLINKTKETLQDSSNVSEWRCENCDTAIRNNNSGRRQTNNLPYNFHNHDMYDYADNTNVNICQEGIRRQHVFPVVNNSRNCQNSFSEKQCRRPLQRGGPTHCGGTINEHSNDSGQGSGYIDVQGNVMNVSHQCVCTIEQSQWIKMCSSIKVLKRIVFALCVFNIILLIILIAAPVCAVIYFQASKDSGPAGSFKSQTSNEQHRIELSCVKCQSLMHKFHNFTRTKTVIESMGDEYGQCCLSDTGKLMTIINQISTEAVEIAKGSVCVSCRSETIQTQINKAVHLKSKGNGFDHVSKVFEREKKFIESTHFVGWETPVRDNHQGLWGKLDIAGTSVKVNSPGMYFVYVMIQHKPSAIKGSRTVNMTTSTTGTHHAPLKVTLYKREYGADGESNVSPISQMYYSTGNTVQQNTYFGRIVHLTESDKIYVGIYGIDFIPQESDSHYMGLFKI
ncbi:hypothetical protein ACJMK2_018813 [Sinanodonta woodiana]|uniref:THD domain-containing protein n=1 Tax=Sinanodonta woodiana TaxID=1069815 RepID=A0ABD3UIH1_SINWO